VSYDSCHVAKNVAIYGYPGDKAFLN